MKHALNHSVLILLCSTFCMGCDEGNDDSNKSSERNQCPASQSYYIDACVNNSDLCDNKICKDDETCIDKHCLPNDLLCGNKLCMGEETCRDGECVNLNKQCGDIYCSAVETCFKNKCEPTRLICGESLCKETEICENNACKKNTDLCGEEICKTGEKCLDGQCADESKKCGKGYCRIDETCQNNFCINQTSISQLECGTEEVFMDGKCRTEDELCNKIMCEKSQICVKAQCANPNMLCGNTLCNHGETCIDSLCVNDRAVCGGKVCSNTQTCQNNECVEDQCGEIKYQVGDIIQFGHFEQDRNEETSDPIEWRVLDIQGCRMLLLSEKILKDISISKPWVHIPEYCPGTQPFNIMNMCYIQDRASASFNWSHSPARAWLNGYDASYQYLYFNESGNRYIHAYTRTNNSSGVVYGDNYNKFYDKFTDYTNDNFVEKAFTSEERSRIITSKIVDDSTENGVDVYDEIFILSKAEVEKYFPDIHKQKWTKNDSYTDIIACTTQYVEGRDFEDPDKCHYKSWLLRTVATQEEAREDYDFYKSSSSPSFKSSDIYYFIDESNWSGNMRIGLPSSLGFRPAMWVKLKD